STAQHRLLTPGAHLRCFGEVRAGVHGLEMIHPEMQRFQGPPPPPEPVLTAVYPTTEGLSQYTWRRLMTQALDKIVSEPVALPDHLPAGWLNGGLPDLHSALDTVHRPPQSADLHALLNAEHPAQRRLA